MTETEQIPETPEGWTGPRDGFEAGEKWHSGGGITLRVAVHPEKGLKIVWNPDHDPVEVGVERVEEYEYGWDVVEKLESEEYDSDAEAADALADICERVEAEYGDE